MLSPTLLIVRGFLRGVYGWFGFDEVWRLLLNSGVSFWGEI